MNGPVPRPLVSTTDAAAAPARELPLTGFYRFLATRIERGAMVPTAISRANTLLRTVNKAQAHQFARLGAPPPTTGVERDGDFRVEPIELASANAYVTQFHRHLNAVVGHVASLGLYDAVGLRGVLILGRPLARHQDNGHTIEVLRLCSDGSKNACSKLYGAARKWAKQHGKRRILTYTLPGESGASLKASGFVCTGSTEGGSWHRPSRERTDKAPTVAKVRWELQL